MQVIDTHGTFEEAIATASPAVAALARRLRALIQELHPDAFEVAWPHQGNIGYGIGPRKNTEHYCYIMTMKDRVNLGFFHGVALDDPERRLEGTGKGLRHVKVRGPEVVDEPWLRALIRRAIDERRAALGRPA